MKAITSETHYQKALEDVYRLMRKGEDNVTDNEAKQIEAMAKMIQAYESEHYPFPMPQSVSEIVELKMLEHKLTQSSLAQMLNIGTAKLSQILNGKRKPDVPFLKAVHEKLNVDGNFLLEQV